jgi:hypothetical protein
VIATGGLFLPSPIVSEPDRAFEVDDGRPIDEPVTVVWYNLTMMEVT